MTIKETTPYDNFLGQKNELDAPNDLSKFLDIKEETDDEKEWQKHWKGMPEFIQEENPPYKKIFVSFRNKEDYEEFAQLISQNLSEKTKSIWYPKLDRDLNSLKRWIEVEE